jgi:geranylgeranyl pyrophosphate synthase
MDEITEKKAIHAVPPTPTERKRLRGIIADRLANASLTPPLSMEELSDMSLGLILSHGLDKTLRGWLMVEINNGLWKETVASVPYDKRILLLPQCLRNSSRCQADVDELGLLCRRCGSCRIPTLQDKAGELGILTLVAEGFTPVIGLMESGVVDTVIGVGCLDSLEKAFPLLVRHAVPGMAIPLNRAGCKDTEVDQAYVESLMSMTSVSHSLPAPSLHEDEIKRILEEWFRPDSLQEILGKATDPASAVAREWLAGDGKRWRPYLTIGIYRSLTGLKEIPETLRRAAIAVECFHKASLVHDDIQDNDLFRNNRPTVHSAHGIPTAINVGDLLLGEGYRLLASCNQMELLQVAAAAHVALCKGQGMELQWSRKPETLTLDYVLEIFSGKTVPAFEVALDFGLICSGITDKAMQDTLHTYSRSLGIAYQLQDDAADFAHDASPTLRPSATLAVLCEQNPTNRYLQGMYEADHPIKDFLADAGNKPLLQKATKHVTSLAETYRQQALASLNTLHNTEMKRLLFRLTERILKQ